MDGELMLRNRSCPSATIIPELPYPDPGAAAEWLCRAFGFTVRVRIGNHRVQMNAGDGAIVCVEGEGGGSRVMMRVENVDAHCARAKAAGAKIAQEPQDHPYGERQYGVEDCGGHRWKFTQSIADVAPEDWGGESISLTN